MPTRVSGHSLIWRRLNSDAFADFPFNSFLIQGERKGNFKEKLNVFSCKTQSIRMRDTAGQKVGPLRFEFSRTVSNKILSVCLLVESASFDDRFTVRTLSNCGYYLQGCGKQSQHGEIRESLSYSRLEVRPLDDGIYRM